MPLPEYDFLGLQSKDFFSPLENVLKTLKFELFEIFWYGKSHRVRDDLGLSQLKRAFIDSRCMSCASNIEIGITTLTTDAALNRLSELWRSRLKMFYFHLITQY